MRCKTTCKWVRGGFFFSQPLNSIWHNCSTRRTCPKLAVPMLQAEIASGLEMPLSHSFWGLLPPSSCTCPLPPSPLPRSWGWGQSQQPPRLQTPQKTTGLISLLMQWPLTPWSISISVYLQLGGFLATWDQHCHFPDPACQVNLPAQCLPLLNGSRDETYPFKGLPLTPTTVSSFLS